MLTLAVANAMGMNATFGWIRPDARIQVQSSKLSLFNMYQDFFIPFLKPLAGHGVHAVRS